MPRQRDAGLLAVAADDIQRSRWQPNLRADARQLQGGERGLLRRLDDHAVTDRQRRRNAARADLQRVVPGHDLRADTERLAQRVVQEVPGNGYGLSADLIDGAGIELKVPRGHLDVDAGLPQGLAVVERFQPRQLIRLRANPLRYRCEQP